jgi:hypothetical protein
MIESLLVILVMPMLQPEAARLSLFWLLVIFAYGCVALTSPGSASGSTCPSSTTPSLRLNPALNDIQVRINDDHLAASDSVSPSNQAHSVRPITLPPWRMLGLVELTIRSRLTWSLWTTRCGSCCCWLVGAA